MDESSSKRTRASGEVLDYLLAEFNKNHNPTPEERKEFSDKTGMNEKAVRIWFQNRRAKLRKFEKISKSSANSSRSNSLNMNLNNLNLNLNNLNHATPDVPTDINDNYGFIDCSSLSVGSWQRIKSGYHDPSLLQSNLVKLSPFTLNAVMKNVDLLVILSKKNLEINYFFLAIANNNKILFRIFYPMSSILTCSLLDNNITRESSELRLSLSHPPKFSVYFFDGVHANSNQWSICDDFSEGQQVSQAYVTDAGTCMPHVLVGIKNSLQYLNAYISENNQLLQHQQLQQNLTPPDSDLGLPKYNQPSHINLPDNHGSSGNFQFTTDDMGMWEDSSLRSDTPIHSAQRTHSVSPGITAGVSPDKMDTYHDGHLHSYHDSTSQIDTPHSIFSAKHPAKSSHPETHPDHNATHTNSHANSHDTYLFEHPTTPEFLSTISGDRTPGVLEKLKDGVSASASPSLVNLGSHTSGDDATYTHLHNHHDNPTHDNPHHDNSHADSAEIMAADDFLVTENHEFDFDFQPALSSTANTPLNVDAPQSNTANDTDDGAASTSNGANTGSNMDSFIDYGSNY